MDIWKKITGEFVDIIEWLDDTHDTLVWRFPRYNNEIKYGAKLIVRESQAAVFINEGQVGDVFKLPGTYTLKTENLPILSTLKGWKYGFESPFKAEVYFCSTRQFTDLKWGTANPIMLRDAEFGPVRLRAFGTYSVRVGDPMGVIREIAGTSGRFSTEGISDQLRNLIVSRFADILGERKIPVLDLAANYNELGDFLTQQIGPDFAAYGLVLSKLLVENISLPPAVEEALDKRSSMGVIGNLGAYAQFQAANAMEQAAKNPGGPAGAGMGMGMGVVMAQTLGQTVGAPGAGGAPATPPPVPTAPMFFAAYDGQQAGPFPQSTLAEHVRAGKLTRQTLVWRAGLAQWTPAGELPELAGVFGALPPPLPGR